MTLTGLITAPAEATDVGISTPGTVTTNTAQTSLRTDTATLQFQKLPNSSTGINANAATITLLCTVTTQYIYERKSFNYMGIGTKPSVTCPFAVDSITIVTTLKKQTLFGWTNSPFTRSVTYASSLAPLDIAVTCTNTKNTLWDAEVDATAIYQGAKYSTTVYPGNAPQTFPCGT